MRPNPLPRPGLTLVELLVTMGIIAFLATLTAFYFPSFQDREMVSRGADQLSGWLLSAKQQAKRDGRSTGIRLTVDPTTKLCTTLSYIQQPDAFAPGTYTGFTPASGTTGPIALFTLPAGMDFTKDPLLVSPGDYLEVNSMPPSHRITAVTASALTLDLNTNTLLLPNPVAPATLNLPYRLIQQPRVVAGEQPLNLPANVGISFEAAGTITQLSQNAPVTNNSFDVLFAPSGAVLAQGSGQIILWVRDLHDPINSADLLANNPRLIIVQPRTGAIITQPVASGADPYLFTRDGTSSGL